MTSGRIDSASRLIRADPAAVYQAYVDPLALAQWLAPSGMTCQIDAFDARVGGEYCIVLTYKSSAHSGHGKTTRDADVVRGRFLELVPNRRIVQSVRFASPDPQFADEMRLTWLMQAEPEGTTVSITAEHVPEGIAAADHIAGFTATLANLAAFVEGRDSLTRST